MRAALPAVLLLVLSALAPAQDRSGLIPLGNGRVGTPDDAVAAGLFFYRDRWLSTKLKPKLDAWEKQDAKSVEWKDAYRTESKNYRITTNLPRYIVELEVKPFLDALFETYVRVFRADYGLSNRAANQYSIRIYHGFSAYLENERADRSNPGYFTGDELVTFYEETDPSEFFNTVFHEGAHQFFAAMLPGANLPIWLDEALATYFEGCTYSRVTRKIDGPLVPPDRLDWAKTLLTKAKAAGADLSPDRMFMSVPEASFEADHYALAWSFVHYLVHRDGGRKRAAFAKFLKEMNGAGIRPVADVFQRATKESLDEVGLGWVDATLALDVPPSPEWVLVDATEPGDADVRDGDVIWSVNGTSILTTAQFADVWSKRPPDRPTELRLVRRIGAAYTYETAFVDVTLPAGSQTKLEATTSSPRSFNLVD